MTASGNAFGIKPVDVSDATYVVHGSPRSGPSRLMFGNDSDRPRGAVVTILDDEKLMEVVRERAREQRPDLHEDWLQPGPSPQMLVPGPEGSWAIVNGEGVGNGSFEGKADIFVTAGFSYVRITLTGDDIAPAITDKYIDLADGIRMFGDRLDRNHAQWRAFHSEADAPAVIPNMGVDELGRILPLGVDGPSLDGVAVRLPAPAALREPARGIAQ